MTVQNQTFADLVEAYRNVPAPTEGFRLFLGDVAVAVAANDPVLTRKLTDYFHGFVVDAHGPAEIQVIALEAPEPDLGPVYTDKAPEPGKKGIKEEFLELDGGRVVRKKRTGMHFFMGPGVNLAVGPCRANDNQVVNFINSRLIQWHLDRGALLAHAAGVERGGWGLALAGFAGAGKSTLALHLMSQGSNFVSNDRLLLLPDGRMLGVPKLPRINPGTALTNPDLARVIPEGQRAAFSELDPDELWTLEHKFDVPIHECFGPGRFTLSSPLCGLVILNWRRNGLALQFRDVDLRTRTDLLPAVRKDPGLFFLNDGRPLDHSEERYLERLSGTRVVEITGGVDFSAAVRFCRQEFGPSV